MKTIKLPESVGYLTERNSVDTERDRLLKIIEDAPDFIGMADMQGHLKFHNIAARRMLGLPEDADLSAMEIRDVHPAWVIRLILEEGIPTVLRQGFWRGESALLHKDGHEIPVSQALTLHCDASGNPLFTSTIMSDITERKQTEAALREHKNRLDEAQRIGKLGFLDWDLTRNEIELSDETLRMYGLDPSIKKLDIEEVIKLVHPDDVAFYVKSLYDAIEKGTKHEIEHRIVRPDGREVYVHTRAEVYRDAEGKPIRVLGTAQDITRSKAAEEKIHRLTQFYAALSQCNETIVRCTREEELFPEICRDVVQFGGMKMAWIGLLDAASQRVHPVASYGEGLAYLDGIEISANDNDPAGRSPIGTAIREGHPYWILDFLNDPLTATHHENGVRFGWRSTASLPLFRNGVAIGAFNLYSDKTNAFDEAARKLLTEMAIDISFALDNFAHEAERKLAEAKVTASELSYRRLFESSKDGILILDAVTGMIVDVNPFLIMILGYSYDEFIGKKIWELSFFKNILENKDNFMDLQRQEYIRYEDLPLQATDGRVFHVEFISNVYTVNGGKVVQCNIRDITKRWRAEELLRESEARYKRIIEGLTDYQYTVRVENGLAVDALQSPGCVTVTGYTPEDFAADQYLWIQLVVPEDRDRIRGHVQQILEGKDILPIEYCITRKDGEVRRVSDTTILFKDAFGNLQSYDGVIKDITERKNAEEQAQCYVAQLESALMRTVGVATALIEMRDPYTAGHERRVSEIAAAIGRELGWDARRVEGLRVAGQLHDIGKISTPAEILAKPGKITAAEYSLIKEHPQAGYDALKDVAFPWPVAEVAWQHHERMDGSGYPRGLRGDEILLEARIMSVADVVEAMASHRPYRPGQGIDKALEEIERGSGSVYDTTVAEACLRLFREQGYVLPT